tara:strand:- start:1753 stop:2457 length:705 start_codon:yes stop_codon:yes gene_type:complete
MADDLLELHNLASTLLETLEPRQRRTLLRRLAGDMRRANQRRMARQKAPDGTAWEKRKPRTAAAAATRPTRFLYPSGGGGEPRLVDMRSWIGRGDMIVGFDREADGLRTFRKDRVIRWLPAEGAAEPDGLPAAARGRGRVRKKAETMFRGLRSSRFLRTGASSDQAWVEFTDRASRIARVHHYGLRDRVAVDGPMVDYPERELLGFAPADERWILNGFIDNAGEALGWGRRAGR